jgi:hypothetical protein
LVGGLSVNLDNVGTVVASRKLTVLGDDKKEIMVLIGMPEPYLDTSDYYCPFQIQGIGSERIEYAVGIDSVQAMLLAFKRIPVLLLLLNKELEGRLRWEGDESGDLGFPMEDVQ